MKTALLAILTALAATVSEPAFGGQETGRIASVGVADWGTAYVTKQGGKWGSGLDSACSGWDGWYIAFGASGELGRMMYESFLTALIEEKNVTVWTDGCRGNNPKVTRVQVNAS